MRRPLRFKPVLYSVVIVVAALDIYWHLYTGGWLTNSYHLNDPDIVNLALAILEPVLFLVVVAYWLTASATLQRILFWSFVLQLLICAGFGLVILLFMLTWHPRMM
jgi:hypothetical protein